MAERLSDHEIRDITNALEAGIPIDDVEFKASKAKILGLD